MSTILASTYPSSNNQLETSSNPMHQVAMPERQTLSYMGNCSTGNDHIARPYTQSKKIQLTTNALFQADGVEVYDSDCDDVPNAQPSFMANISSYGSDALAEGVQGGRGYKFWEVATLVPQCDSAIMTPDSEETLMLAEESRSKTLLKQRDPIMLEKKVNTTPVDYAVLNQLSQDFEKRFVPQTELSTEQ
ncbi:hypothetical protein Tco_0616314, partial [Tanacetum coccineum]